MDRRILYLAVLTAGLAVFVGGRALAMLANAVLLLGAVMWLWVRLSLGNLSAYLEPERPVLTSAEPVLVRVRLNNEGFLPLPRVAVRAAAGCRPRLTPAGEVAAPAPERSSAAGAAVNQRGARRKRGAATTPGALGRTGSATGREVVLEGRVPALGTSSVMLGPLRLPRGAYRLGPLQVEVRDPLGLWRATASVSGDRVTVYPRVLPLQAPPLVVPGRSFGRMRTRRPSEEDFSNLVEVRAFQPGDNPRLIDWKATARRGSWQVRVLEEGAVAEVWLFVDAGSELAVELAASLARWLALSGSLVGLVGQGVPPVTILPGRGEAKWREIMQGLLRVQPADLPLAELMASRQASLPRGATVIAVTPRLDALLFDHLLRIRQVGRGTYLVLVPPSGDHSDRRGRPPAAGHPEMRPSEAAYPEVRPSETGHPEVRASEAGHPQVRPTEAAYPEVRPDRGISCDLAAGCTPGAVADLDRGSGAEEARVAFLRERSVVVLVGRQVGHPLRWHLSPALIAREGAI